MALRIVEKDFYQFQKALRRAIARGTRIDPLDKQAWSDWVREHDVQEAMFKGYGAQKCENLQPVIIDQDDDWGGYYLFNVDEETVLVWVRD